MQALGHCLSRSAERHGVQADERSLRHNWKRKGEKEGAEASGRTQHQLFGHDWSVVAILLKVYHHVAMSGGKDGSVCAVNQKQDVTLIGRLWRLVGLLQ
jgi:hypothetical protein